MPSSALNRAEGKLREVSGRIGAVGHIASEGDVQIVTELTDDIRDAVIDYQASHSLESLLRSSHLGKTGPDGAPTGHI